MHYGVVFFFLNVGGRGVQDGGHMYTHDWFMSTYGKTHYNMAVISLQLKYIN